MKYAVIALVVAIGGAAFLAARAQQTESAQHLMRVYAVMGGAGGDAGVQYVELRMTSLGQTFVNGHDLCFFDESGAPWARFTFTSNVANGANGASILVGTAAMDAAWPAGSPDFTFGAGNTTAIAPGASVNAPVPVPAGKVAFGMDSASEPPEMCGASFAQVYDSVAYGDAYAGGVDFDTKFAQDLPVAGAQAITLVGNLCSGCPQDNSTDYALQDAVPRNNAGDSGPVSENGATPTPTPEPTGTPAPTPTPGPTGTPTPTPDGTPAPLEFVWGDVDCGGAVNAVDALKKLQFVAGLDFAQEAQCPEVGLPVQVATASGDGLLWGDVNCDGAVNAVDALQTLRHVAALGVSQGPDCPEIGGPVLVTP